MTFTIRFEGRIVHEVRVHRDACPDATLEAIHRLEQRMSLLSDKIDAVNGSLNAAVARVQEDVAALQAEIDRLKQTAVTPEDLERLSALQATLDALDPVKSATLPVG